MSEIPGLSHISLGSVPDSREGIDIYARFRHSIHRQFGAIESAWLAKDEFGHVEAWFVMGDTAAKSWAQRVRAGSEAVWAEAKQVSRERIHG